MRFEWDEAKNRSNQTKHGLSFETAMLVFDDPFAWSGQDSVVGEEERWQTIGLVHGRHIVLVAHTWKEEVIEDVVRIISARKATRREVKLYESHR